MPRVRRTKAKGTTKAAKPKSHQYTRKKAAPKKEYSPVAKRKIT